MVVESADYGDFNNNGVFNDDKNVNTECSALASCQVKSHCGGERSCELTMNNELLPSQYCRPDTLKQIYTKYTCRDTCGSSTITTGKGSSDKATSGGCLAYMYRERERIIQVARRYEYYFRVVSTRKIIFISSSYRVMFFVYYMVRSRNKRTENI